MYETSFPVSRFKLRVPARGDYPLTDVLIKNNVTPILLPTVPPTSGVISKIFDRIDGLILGGGDDVTPALYHEPVLFPGLNYPSRDRFEAALVRGAIKRRKPTLGICRGNQMLNVALGGTLYQNIYAQINHSLLDHTHGFHPVTMAPGSQLYRTLGARQLVNSRHHQAIKKLGQGLRVVSRANDGIIEGVETSHALLQGVQWHPENLWARCRAEESLFRAFIDRVAQNAG